MIDIRPTQPTDFEDVLVLLGQLWPDKSLDRTRLREVFDKALASQDCVYLSACEGDRVIGFCTLIIHSSLWQEGVLGHIGELIVDANCRGRGVGTAMLERAAEAARRKGCRRIELDSAFHRTAAHGFYEGLGFEKRAFLFSKSLQSRAHDPLIPAGTTTTMAASPADGRERGRVSEE